MIWLYFEVVNFIINILIQIMNDNAYMLLNALKLYVGYQEVC